MGIAALIGAVLIILSSVMLFQVIATRRGGVRTQGTVIDNRESTNTAGAYAPVIRFTTQHGRTVEFESNVSTPVVHEVGKQVPVVYQPSKPERAVLATTPGSWLLPTLLLAAGLVVFLVGIIGLLAGSSG